MTLNITMVTAWGIWQSSDHRLTNSKTGSLVDDHSLKHVTVICKDGVALISYTGIGKVKKGVPVSEWLRKLLRGESRSLNETIELLRTEASNAIGPLVEGRFEHVFSFGAYLAEKPWIGTVLNVKETADGIQISHTREFNSWAERVDVGSRFIIAGTHKAVSARDRALIERVLKQRPNKVEDFHGLLASINKRAHLNRRYGHLISPGCITTYLPRTGAAETKIHDWSTSNYSSGPIPAIPTVLYGIDMTETMEIISEQLMDLDSQTYDEEMWKRRLEEASKRSVRPDV